MSGSSGERKKTIRYICLNVLMLRAIDNSAICVNWLRKRINKKELVIGNLTLK